MRQSRKEAELERMMRESASPDRREAMALAQSASTEFAEEWHGGRAAGTRNSSRHSPGGRG